MGCQLNTISDACARAYKVAWPDLSWTALVILTPSVLSIGPTADAISTPPGLRTLKHSAKHLHIKAGQLTWQDLQHMYFLHAADYGDRCILGFIW